jgi:hypothetical protein
MGGVDPKMHTRGLRRAGVPGSREVASFEVCIFLHSSMSVITIIMVWSPWIAVLRPARRSGGWSATGGGPVRPGRGRATGRVVENRVASGRRGTDERRPSTRRPPVVQPCIHAPGGPVDLANPPVVHRESHVWWTTRPTRVPPRSGRNWRACGSEACARESGRAFDRCATAGISRRRSARGPRRSPAGAHRCRPIRG